VVAKTNRALLLRDTPGFATLFLATLDLAADTIACCSAGHPPAFIGREGSGVTALDRFNPALNVSDDSVFTPGLEPFGPHDFLLLYTDGVIEARRGRELFGEARLAELVDGSSWDKVEQLPRRIMSQLQRFSRGRLRDDLAIVAVARQPEPKPGQARSKRGTRQSTSPKA
jgi:Serine phosphatase RsbU, regulator of sigma subunit